MQQHIVRAQLFIQLQLDVHEILVLGSQAVDFTAQLIDLSIFGGGKIIGNSGTIIRVFELSFQCIQTTKWVWLEKLEEYGPEISLKKIWYIRNVIKDYK